MEPFLKLLYVLVLSLFWLLIMYILVVEEDSMTWLFRETFSFISITCDILYPFQSGVVVLIFIKAHLIFYPVKPHAACRHSTSSWHTQAIVMSVNRKSYIFHNRLILEGDGDTKKHLANWEVTAHARPLVVTVMHCSLLHVGRPVWLLVLCFSATHCLALSSSLSTGNGWRLLTM